MDGSPCDRVATIVVTLVFTLVVVAILTLGVIAAIDTFGIGG